MPKPASKPGSTLPSRADDALRHALELAGCRWTRQRAAVYEYLESVVDHPTTEEIFKAVQRRLPGISLATVYNALDALVKARLATRLAYGDGSSRYDCRAEDHYHLRDVETGEVRDLPASFDPTLLDKLDPQLKVELSRRGFEVTGYRLEVLGRFARS